MLGEECAGHPVGRSFAEFVRDDSGANLGRHRCRSGGGSHRRPTQEAQHRQTGEIARRYNINQPTVSRIVAQDRTGSHKIRAIRNSGRGARDANLEEAALENSPENLDEDQRRRAVARQARDGELPGGDRRTSR
jgi:hypothetical protein